MIAPAFFFWVVWFLGVFGGFGDFEGFGGRRGGVSGGKAKKTLGGWGAQRRGGSEAVTAAERRQARGGPAGEDDGSGANGPGGCFSAACRRAPRVSPGWTEPRSGRRHAGSAEREWPPCPRPLGTRYPAADGAACVWRRGSRRRARNPMDARTGARWWAGDRAVWPRRGRGGARKPGPPPSLDRSGGRD
jgi:hypothetical protein